MMDIQEERKVFEAEFSKIKSDIAFWLHTWDEEMQGYNHHVMCWFWYMWQAAKANATAYESCSVKSHEIIINETKNELIDSYDIAKEDEYLLEALVYRGVCIGNAQASAVPEGFVLVPKEPTELFKEHLKNHLFDLWAGDHGCDWDGFLSVDAINHNNIWKMMIEAQEQSHD